MGVWRRRAVSTAAVAALLIGVLAAPPAAAYSSPADIPAPAQEYSARDYADALWNLDTTTYVRTHQREERGDCEVQTYTATHPLDEDDQRTSVQVISADDGYCHGDDGDRLRAEFDEQAQDDDSFYHGRPYELSRETPDSRPYEVLRSQYYGTWADITGNGVDSRTEIHARDTGNSSFSVSGTYYDHYTGQHVNIAETETHGEHMVPVSYTWPDLQHRSQEDRVAYYNDHMNLISAIGWVNRDKSGSTPTEWMPENEDFWCEYSMTWAHIANKHELSLYRSDIDHLRELLWGCLDQTLDGDQTLTGDRSPDLQWQALPPSSDPDEVDDVEGEGPRDHYSARDYTDAIWNLENHIRTRSVERESQEECDVQTHTTEHPNSGRVITYARVISPENTHCAGDEGDELRAELDELAEDDHNFRHSSPLAGQSQDSFGEWAEDDDGVTTAHQILARDLDDVEWDADDTEVVEGSLLDPYSGEEEDHDADELTVDRILPVEHAWVEMEHRGREHRERFFNDPANLLATTVPMYDEKNADAPRNWMPPDVEFQCRYAMAWTHTAASYDISLFASDQRELRRTLYECLTEEVADSESIDSPRRDDLAWAGLPPY